MQLSIFLMNIILLNYHIAAEKRFRDQLPDRLQLMNDALTPEKSYL